MGEPRQRGGAGSLWESIFDPANARLLADAQAQGLRAASDLIERVVAGFGRGDGHEPDEDDSDGPSPSHTASSGSSSAGFSAPSDEAGRVLEAWTDVLRAVASTLGPAPSGPAGNGSGGPTVELDVATPAAGEVLRIGVDPDGQVRDGPVRVWLHNGAESPTGPLSMGAGELRSSTGRTLASALTFEPATVELPARSSRGVAISLEAAEVLEEGTYRGVVQVAGAPQLWLPVEVSVAGATDPTDADAGSGPA